MGDETAILDAVVAAHRPGAPPTMADICASLDHLDPTIVAAFLDKLVAADKIGTGRRPITGSKGAFRRVYWPTGAMAQQPEQRRRGRPPTLRQPGEPESPTGAPPAWSDDAWQDDKPPGWLVTEARMTKIYAGRRYQDVPMRRVWRPRSAA